MERGEGGGSIKKEGKGEKEVKKTKICSNFRTMAACYARSLPIFIRTILPYVSRFPKSIQHR